MGMPGHPLASPLAWGVGTGIDNTAAAWRRYHGLGGYVPVFDLCLTNRPSEAGTHLVKVF